MPWMGPHTIKRGPLAGRYFSEQQDYQNALARERGFKSYGQARHFPGKTVQQAQQTIREHIPFVDNGHFAPWSDARNRERGVVWTPPKNMTHAQWDALQYPEGATFFMTIYWVMYDGKKKRLSTGYLDTAGWNSHTMTPAEKVIKVYFIIP